MTQDTLEDLLKTDGELPLSADFFDAARAWLTRGARLVGGCCRVTPAQIASIAAAVSAQ